MRLCSCGRKIKTKKAKVCRHCRRKKFKALHDKITECHVRLQVARLQKEAALT